MIEFSDSKMTPTKSEVKQLFMDPWGPMCMPRNPAEMKELQELASSGPQDVYQWIYGWNSPMMDSAPLTWDEIGIADPAEGLKLILAAIGTPKG